MLWGAHIGNLELRNEGGETRLRATFPYSTETVLVERYGSAPERREIIGPRAFGAKVESDEDIHFLAGHDFDRPLASRSAGTLVLTDSDDALVLNATISSEMREVSYVRDFLGAHAAGLIRGLSPGFRVRPGGERVHRQGNAVVRTISAADLIEISAVTKPAYSQAQIEARDWAYDPTIRRANLRYSNCSRWR